MNASAVKPGFFPLILLVLLFFALPVTLQADPLQIGKDYELITPARPNTGAKPEIVEVFNFKCPHCADLHPEIEAWAEKNRARFDIQSMPIFWGTQTDTPVRAYYAALYLGHGANMQQKIFDTHFKNGLNIENPEELAFQAEEIGLDAKQFQQQMRSFGVISQLKRTADLQKAWGVDSTPTLVINGRYRVSPTAFEGDMPRMFKTVEQLATQ
ncbi:MAG: thiol:disulfide interchange protein DsbA/DsbL [Magnetococcus sp. DMHC-6]